MFASGVLGPLSRSRTPVYAPRTTRDRALRDAMVLQTAALLDLAPPKGLRTGERAFLNILSCY